MINSGQRNLKCFYFLLYILKKFPLTLITQNVYVISGGKQQVFKKKSSDCDHERNSTTGITFKAPGPILSPSLWLSFLFMDPIPWPN